MRKIVIRLFSISAVIVIIGLTACVKTKYATGYNFDDIQLTKIVPHQTTQDQVVQYLGSPSTKSFFGNEIWYYVGRNYESKAFLTPKLVSQKVVAVEFKDGVVSSVKNYDKDKAVDVAINKESTPTEGNDVGVLGQLLGNIGKFNSKGRQHAPAGR